MATKVQSTEPPSRKPKRGRDRGTSEPRLICLVFVTVSPYKGIEELIERLSQRQIDAQLHVVGRVSDPVFAQQLRSAATRSASI